YSVIVGVGLGAQTLGSFATHPVAHGVGTRNLLWVVAGAIATAALVHALHERRRRSRTLTTRSAGARAVAPTSLVEDLRGQPHFRKLATIAILLATTTSLVDFLYSSAAKARFGRSEELAGFFGLVNGS